MSKNIEDSSRKFRVSISEYPQSPQSPQSPNEIQKYSKEDMSEGLSYGKSVDSDGSYGIHDIKMISQLFIELHNVDDEDENEDKQIMSKENLMSTASTKLKIKDTQNESLYYSLNTNTDEIQQQSSN